MASAALPTWDQLMIPVLKVLADGQVRSRRQLYDEVAAAERLTQEQKAINLDSGQAKYENRIGWAVTYLAKAKAIYRPSRGQQSITDAGRELLHKYPDGLVERDLRTVDGYESPRDRRQARKVLAEAAIEVPASDLDPIEQDEMAAHASTTASPRNSSSDCTSANRPSSSRQWSTSSSRWATGEPTPRPPGRTIERRRHRRNHRPGHAWPEPGLHPSQALRPRQCRRQARHPVVRRGASRPAGEPGGFHYHRPFQHGCGGVRSRRFHAGRAHRWAAPGRPDDPLPSWGAGQAHAPHR